MNGIVCMRGKGGCVPVGQQVRGLGLALPQPLAVLVCSSDISFLPRNWDTDHRGPLAIYSDAIQPPYSIELLQHPLARARLKDLGFNRPSELPAGAIIGIVDQLIAVTPRAQQSPPKDEPDRIFLDLLPGAFVYQLDGARFIEPIVCDGWYGLESIKPQIAAQLNAALRSQVLDQPRPNSPEDVGFPARGRA